MTTFLICEDGHEYSDRFRRLLGSHYTFERAGDFAEALPACRGQAIVGLLLDLDFRRTPAPALVDEAGAASPMRAESERHRLAGVQGILILRALRTAGVALPALLFADLDDRAQAAFLATSLAPITIVPSIAGLAEIARALADIAAQ